MPTASLRAGPDADAIGMSTIERLAMSPDARGTTAAVAHVPCVPGGPMLYKTEE
ncbi:hypothetical protein [Variovorax sp. PvP013]|uniref:hypothetical protein n=1 Tax=Variovorax sp. PvP013 TaxID=3156435 RepID=UPI003D23F9B8